MTGILGITWKIVEFDQYITPDGRKFNLHSPFIRWVTGIEGTGMPPIEYITERGPFQDGESVKDYFLRPRVIQMGIAQEYKSRNQYWYGRLQLLDVLRPNRQNLGRLGSSPGTLRKVFPGNRMLDIDVYIQQGPVLDRLDHTVWREHSFREVIRFIAYNPVFYDPTPIEHDFINRGVDDPTESPSSDTQLVFPISFPIFFGPTAAGDFPPVDEEGEDPSIIHYVGSWIEFPTIVLVGPLSNPVVITNETTGETITFNYDVQPEETVTFALTYGLKTVTSNVNGNVIGFVSTDSDLGSFHLEPGDNEFALLITGDNTDSRVRIDYKNRYIGY